MNVVEAYIKFRGQLVILVSGLPGCGKTLLAKKISNDFGISYINEADYYSEEKSQEVTLPDDTKVVNIYTDEAIDWNLLNDDINKKKATGVVVNGVSLPKDKIQSEVDYHLHLAISKQRCIEKRREYLEKNKEAYPEEYKLIDTPTEKLKFNRLLFPYYLESKQKAQIDEYIQGTEMTEEETYDKAFELLIGFIENYLYQIKPQKEDRGQSRMKDSGNQEIDLGLYDDSSSSSDIHDGPLVYLTSPEDAKFWYSKEDDRKGL